MPNKFGMGWNISDILGGLGDALSVGAGGEANYLGQIQRDRYGEGLNQFLGGDTQGGMKAIASAGGPTAANQWFENDSNNTYRKGVVANQAEDNRRQAADQKEKFDLATDERIASFFRKASAADWQDRYDRAKEYAQLRGRDFQMLNIPKQFKEGWSSEFDEGLISAKDSITAAETRRHNKATEQDADDTRLVNANLGKARVLTELEKESGRNSRFNAGQTNQNIRQNAGERSQDARSAAARQATRDNRASAVRARIIKDNPGARTQTSSQGRVRYSVDGGKTWINAN